MSGTGKLYASNLERIRIGSIGKPMEKFGKSIRGRSQEVQKKFSGNP